MSTWRAASTAVLLPLVLVWEVVVWSWVHRTWIGSVAVFAFAVAVLDRPALAVCALVAGWAVPAVVVVAWSRFAPVSYERFLEGPCRRRAWRVIMVEQWPRLSRDCGLSSCQVRKRKHAWTGQALSVTVWSHSRLCSVTTAGARITLTVRARPGQTSADVVGAAAGLASATGASSYTARALTPSTATVELVMADHLAGTITAPDPATSCSTAGVIVGRSQNAGLVMFDPLHGGHVAIQGATRSGKSVLCYAYLSALAHRSDVLVCGIDPTGILLTPFTAGRGASWITTTAKDGQHVANVLDAVTTHMDDRIVALVAGGTDKITTYDAVRPAVVVVLEEYPALLSHLAKDDEATGRKGKDRVGPQVERSIGRIVKEGTKVGVTVLVLAQRMSAKAIDTDDRSNVPNRVTMRIDNADAVRMLHDGVDATGIDLVRQFPPGRGLIEAPGLPLQKFQADLTDYDTYRSRCATGITTTTDPGAFTPPRVPDLTNHDHTESVHGVEGVGARNVTNLGRAS